MNLSEYQLISMLNIKVGGESSIAIMIANDALELGKTIFKIEEGIEECQKEINKNNKDIKSMTLKEAREYLICHCGNCVIPDDLDEDEIDEAIDEAIGRAEDQLKINEDELYYMMKEYEEFMGVSYNKEFIVQDLINDVIKQVIEEFNDYEKLKNMYNDNEEFEKTHLIKTIKRLLNECENATTKINKFEIVTCMMCVISNSPVFMESHINFKNTVLLKLEELASQISDIEVDKSEYTNYIQKIRNF
jgi:hypothetical protein